ncbi:MAG: DUF5615 family PIN-like protein [Acidobacteriota bacterium]
MRLLIDMNLTPGWVPALAAAGHESVHWSTVGPISAPDSIICEYARDQRFMLLTNDMDFPRILAHSSNAKPSVILLRGEPLTPELRARPLIQAIADCSADLESGAILTLDWSDRPRARLLPLK